MKTICYDETKWQLVPIEPEDDLIDATRPLFLGLELGCNTIESMRKYMEMCGEDLSKFPEWFRNETGHLTKAGRGILAHKMILQSTPQPEPVESLNVEFGMHGDKMMFKVGVQNFVLDYSPEEQSDFDFMRDMLTKAFSRMKPEPVDVEPVACLFLGARGIEVVSDYGVMRFGDNFDVFAHPDPEVAKLRAQVVELKSTVTEQDNNLLLLIGTVKYLQGIAERGNGYPIPNSVTVEQFVLSYVKSIESKLAVAREILAKELDYQTKNYAEVSEWLIEALAQLGE